MNTKLEMIKKMLATEKRKSDRLDIPVRVYYSAAVAKKWEGPAKTINISGRGLSFLSNDKIAKNSKIKLKMIFPEPVLGTIECKGICAWSKKSEAGYQTGIEFSEMSQQDRKIYVDYIAEKILLKSLEFSKT
jgi:c-di-GMP-binding flagellar brake protein YcgR